MSNASKPGFPVDDASMLVALRTFSCYLLGRAHGGIPTSEQLVDGWPDLDSFVREIIAFGHAEAGRDVSITDELTYIVETAQKLAMFATARVR